MQIRYAYELLKNNLWKRNYDFFGIDEQRVSSWFSVSSMLNLYPLVCVKNFKLVYLSINIMDAGCSWKGQSAICRRKVFRNKPPIVRWSCFKWAPFTIIRTSIRFSFLKRWCIYSLSGADTEDHDLNFLTSNDVQSIFNDDKPTLIMVKSQLRILQCVCVLICTLWLEVVLWQLFFFQGGPHILRFLYRNELYNISHRIKWFLLCAFRFVI